MRRVKRTNPGPEALLLKGAEELEKASAHYGPPPVSEKAFPFGVYKLAEVKAALVDLFGGKCAYCESFYASVQPMDVEHFRPKGAIEGEDHPGYWWIAMAWDNLLPSCIDCNRRRNQITPKGDVSQVRLVEESQRFSRSVTRGTGKKDSFPLAAGGVRATGPNAPLAAEKALLLNPCEDEPSDHLRYLIDRDSPVSFVVSRRLEGGDEAFVGEDGLSLKGGTSIHVYGLNRLSLVQARTELLRRLEFLADLQVDLRSLAEELDSATEDSPQGRAKRAVVSFADRVAQEMRRMASPHMPHSTLVEAWLDDFSRRLADTDI